LHLRNPTEQKGTLMNRIIEQWLAVNSEKHDHGVREWSQEIRTGVQPYAEEWFERHLEEEVGRWLGRGPGPEGIPWAVQVAAHEFYAGFAR
jgi:hypothetical protein